MAIANHVRKPADFILPAEFETFKTTLESLPIEELLEFQRETLAAMAQVKPADDFKPLLLVLERWYRKALLYQHPGWGRAAEQAEAIRRGEKPADIHELDFDQLRGEVARRRRTRSA